MGSENPAPSPEDTEQSRWNNDMRLLKGGNGEDALKPAERAKVDMTDSVISDLTPTGAQREAMEAEMNKDIASKTPEALEIMEKIEKIRPTKTFLSSHKSANSSPTL